MADFSEKLRILIEKLLLHRGKRGASCRVFPPASGVRGYSVVIDYNRVREQVFLDASTVEHYGRTGNEQYVLNAIRTAIHNLERMEKKNDARKARA